MKVRRRFTEIPIPHVSADGWYRYEVEPSMDRLIVIEFSPPQFVLARMALECSRSSYELPPGDGTGYDSYRELAKASLPSPEYATLCDLEMLRTRAGIHTTKANEILGEIGVNPWIFNPQRFLGDPKRCPFCGKQPTAENDTIFYESRLSPGRLSRVKPQWRARRVNVCKNCNPPALAVVSQTQYFENGVKTSGQEALWPALDFSPINVAAGPFAVFTIPERADSLLSSDGGIYELEGTQIFQLCLPGFAIPTGIQIQLADRGKIQFRFQKSSEAFESLALEEIGPFTFLANLRAAGRVFTFEISSPEKVQIKAITVPGTFRLCSPAPDLSLAAPPNRLAIPDKSIPVTVKWDEERRTHLFTFNAKRLQVIDITIKVPADAAGPRKLFLRFQKGSNNIANRHVTLPVTEKETRVTYRFDAPAVFDRIVLYYLDVMDSLVPLQFQFKKIQQIRLPTFAGLPSSLTDSMDKDD